MALQASANFFAINAAHIARGASDLRPLSTGQRYFSPPCGLANAVRRTAFSLVPNHSSCARAFKARFQSLFGAPMNASAVASRLNPHVQSGQWPFNPQLLLRSDRVAPSPPSELSIRVLRTEAERLVIKDLRRYAPMDAERDLNADLDVVEEFKDSIGMVMAIYRGGKAIATIRLVPSGYGVTLAEKSWCDVALANEGYGERSWEVGRLIVAPEHRNAELLPRCLALALRELIKASDAEFLHASCSPLMARLYRRVGFAIERTIQGENGLQHALIHARVDIVAKALKVAPISPARGLSMPLFVPIMQ